MSRDPVGGERQTRLLTLFPDMIPMLLHKALGQIPHYLAKEHNWSCELAFCQTDDAPLIAPQGYEQWVSTVRLGVGLSRRARFQRFALHVAKSARETDVLLLYHLTPESIALATIYKTVHPKGVAILKLDMDVRGLEAFERPNARLTRALTMPAFRHAPFDFATTETSAMLESLRPHFRRVRFPLHLLPVGFACDHSIDVDDVFAKKEKIILTVGRLGIPQKHNELLLDALERLGSDTLSGWRIWMVGEREPSLDRRIERFRRENPDLADALQTPGFIASRDDLHALYKRASVYCLTSRWESFATVLAEALYHGCYLVSTRVGAASDLTDGGRDGDLVPVEDLDALTAALRRIVTGEREIEGPARITQARVSRSYSWSGVARTLAELVEGRRARS